MTAISYWRRRNNYYRLLGSCCKGCGAEHFPPVFVCRICSSRDIQEKEMPKTGNIVTYTVLRETMTRFEAHAPMILAIIQLENQVKVLSQIVDCSEDAIKIGSRVKAVFRKVASNGDSDTIQYGYKFAIDAQ